MADVVDVNSTSSDIGGHHNLNIAILKLVQRLDALSLSDFAREQSCFEPLSIQLFLKPPGFIAAIYKHDHFTVGLLGNEVAQDHEFF